MEPKKDCPDLSPNAPFNLDKPAPYCGLENSCPPQEPTFENVEHFFDNVLKDKTGLGVQANCDPMQAGQIINDLAKTPNRNIIYRYAKSIRGCDEALTDLFRGLVVLDEQGVAHPVPIIWGTQERAVAAVLQENVRKDTSLVVDRVKLPIMSIYSSDFAVNLSRYTYHQALNYFRRPETLKPRFLVQEKRPRDTVFGFARGIPIDIGYTLTIWTYFVEDMNQILEQILLKFSPIAYIRVQGVQWETIVKLDSIGNNINMEPGNTANRVVKFQIHMTAETYIAQPIDRQKTVLSTRVAMKDGLNDDEITEIISRLEEAVDELNDD